EADVAEAELVCVPARLGQHLGRHVDADDLARRANLPGGNERVEPGAGPYVDHPLGWGQLSEREGIPDPGERLDGVVREGVDDGLVVAEPGREGSPGVEVMLSVGIEGDVAVLVPHL